MQPRGRAAPISVSALYRHFPKREALYQSVYRHEVEQLGELAERLKSEASAVGPLRQWLQSTVAFVATKKGMMAALAIVQNAGSELTAYSFARLTASIGALLSRAVQAGEIRADVSADDLLRVGTCMLRD